MMIWRSTIAALDTGANVTMVASIQMVRLVLVGPFIVRRLVARSREVTVVAEIGTDDRKGRT